MLEVFEELRDTVAAGRPLAYCRLIQTRGSTPQKAGALMLVYRDGQQAGTLGGGCVEAEVKRRALTALADRKACVERFQLDSDYGWDDGLICGGRMDVLIQPILADDSASLDAQQVTRYFTTLCEAAAQGRGLTEVVVPEGEKEPAMLLFDADRQLLGSVHGDGADVEHVSSALEPLSERPKPSYRDGAAYLPLLPRCRLLIVGGGHVGQAVAELAQTLDFDVWVVDDRGDMVSTERFPTAQKRIAGVIDDVLPGLPITDSTYCLIVTRGHNHDEQALFHLADRGARYVGMIGSKRKIKLIMDDLREQGVPSESLDRVYAPVGLDIGSQTVPEIALSICAELVAHRNRQGATPGRDDQARRSAEAAGER